MCILGMKKILQHIKAKYRDKKYGSMTRKETFDYIYAKNIWGGVKRKTILSILAGDLMI